MAKNYIQHIPIEFNNFIITILFFLVKQNTFSVYNAFVSKS